MLLLPDQTCWGKEKGPDYDVPKMEITSSSHLGVWCSPMVCSNWSTQNNINAQKPQVSVVCMYLNQSIMISPLQKLLKSGAATKFTCNEFQR